MAAPEPEAARPLPTDAELEAEIKVVLEGRDLTTTSLKEVRAELERRFELSPGALDGNKERLKELVAAEITRIQEAEGAEDDADAAEEDVAEAEVEAEPAAERRDSRSHKDKKRSSKHKEADEKDKKAGGKKRGREDDEGGSPASLKKAPAKERQASLMTREDFMKKAKPFKMDVGDKKLMIQPKKFTTGSCGFYGMGKAEMMIGGKSVSLQCQVSCTVIGSKQWQDDWRDTKGRKLRAFFLATDDPGVEESFKKRYGEMIATYEKRTLKRNEGDGIEDAFVDLLLLAQGSEIIGSFRSSFSAVAALFHSVPLCVVNEESVGTDDFGGYREVPLAAADPWKDSGKFYLVGSWDDWKNFTELRSVGINNVDCSARICLGDTTPREAKFQVVRDKDWNQRFYPSEDGAEILGPSNAHGSNWQAKVPPKAKYMRVTFSPKGAWRTLHWKFFNYGNKELPSVIEDDSTALCNTPKEELRTGPAFFLAGSWDGWTFTELPPRSTRDAVCCCRARLRKAPGTESFQIVEDKSWARRYFPRGGSIEGPSDKKGASWEVQIPALCSELEVIWDPRGARKVEWNFVDRSGCYLELEALARDFALVGSWNDWGEPSKLRPARNGSNAYRCRVGVKRAPAIFEFMVIEDGNQCRCFFPMQGAQIILGPCRNDRCCHWSVEIPEGCHFLEVTWDPRGQRSLAWRLLGRSGAELPQA